MTILLVVFLLYLALMIGIAVYWQRTASTSLDDFLLGGRTITSWLLAFTTSATSLSGWLMLGFAGYVYRFGFSARWLSFAIILGAGCAVWIVGERLRKYSYEIGALTVADFLEARYYDSSHVIRLLTALVIIIATTVYIMGQIVATAKVSEFLFGWPYIVGVLVGGIVVLIYTAVGGYLAVVWTDFIQGIIMVLGSCVGAYLGVKHAGGLTGIFRTLESVDPKLTEGVLPLVTIVGFVIGAGLFGYMSQPQLHVRFMSAKDRRNMLCTLPIVVAVQSLLVYGVLWAGVSARAIFPNPDMLPKSDTELVLIHLFNTFLHPVLAGVFIAAAFAAIMSTADSLLILASGCVTEDIINKVLNRKLSQKQLVFVGRVTVVVIAIVAMYLAIRPFELIFWIAEWAWGALTAFGPPVLLGLYWRRATREGCIAGLVVAFLTSVLWSTPSLIGAYKQIHMSLPTFILGFITVVVVSLLTKSPPQEIQDLVRAAGSTTQKISSVPRSTQDV